MPHMGWNQLLIGDRPPLLAGLDDGVFAYFVHSYYVVPRDRAMIATETDYPEPFTSMIWQDNIVATQFHPEKSQANGLACSAISPSSNSSGGGLLTPAD